MDVVTANEDILLDELLVGSIFGNEHSSPLKYTFVGNPSPPGMLIPGIFFFVNEITDCCFPGTRGSFSGLAPSVSATR